MPIDENALAPSLGMNSSFVQEWTPNQPFLNLFKLARPWTTSTFYDPDDLDHWNTGGSFPVDDHGWPTAIPEDADYDFIRTELFIGDETVNESGRYVIKWDGEGEIRLQGGVAIIPEESVAGRLVVQVDAEDNLQFQIHSTDPNGTNDYIRNVQVVKEEYEPLLDAGVTFDPDYVEKVQDFRTFRFMNWGDVNDSEQSTTDATPHADDAMWTIDGVPLSVMVEFANMAKVDPWFNIPHTASDEWVEGFAAYIAENLDPSLKVFVEYSNEVWNPDFIQYDYAIEQGQALFGPDAVEPGVQWYGVRSAQVSEIVAGAFEEGDLGTRLETVVSAWTGMPGLEQNFLNAPDWVAQGHDAPAGSFTVYATAPYVGLQLSYPENAETILGWIDDPEIDAVARAFEEVRTGAEFGLEGTVEAVRQELAYHNQVAESHGMRMVGYEGGQHFAALQDGTSDPRVVEFAVGLNNDPRIGDLTLEILEAWRDSGGHELNYFTAFDTPDEWGDFGVWRSRYEETSYKAEAIEQFMAENPVWWDDTRPAAHFEGAQIIVGEAGDVALVGGIGDDTLFAAGGSETSIDGAEGVDTLILAGNRADYGFAIHADGSFTVDNGLRAYQVSNVETVTFSNEGAVAVADIVAAGDVPAPTVTAPVVYEAPTDIDTVIVLEDGSLRQVDLTGNSTTHRPNGDVELAFVDGSGEIRGADGSLATYAADGSGTFDDGQGNTNAWGGDGSTSWTRADGTSGSTTADGVETYTFADGRVSVTQPDGSSTLTHPDGQVDSWDVNGNRTSTYPDGRVTVENVDGSGRTDYANGDVEVTDADGLTTYTYADGAVDQWAPDGSGGRWGIDGSYHTWAADGSGTWGDGQGNTESWTADGTSSWTTADGTSGVTNPDGSGHSDGPDGRHDEWDAEGNRTISHADGSVETQNADGSGNIQNVDGSSYSWFVDGSTTWNDGQGNTVTTFADGSQEWHNADGSWGTTDVDGNETYYPPATASSDDGDGGETVIVGNGSSETPTDSAPTGDSYTTTTETDAATTVDVPA